MFALIVRERGRLRPRSRRLRRPRMLASPSCDPAVAAPPGRPDFDDEAFELIGPGNERSGDMT